jgi:hypothetical protein
MKAVRQSSFAPILESAERAFSIAVWALSSAIVKMPVNWGL